MTTTTRFRYISVLALQVFLASLTLYYTCHYLTNLGASTRPISIRKITPSPISTTTTPLFEKSKPQFDQEQFNTQSKQMRLNHLEEQALFALNITTHQYNNPVFSNALIAGDVVITHLLHRMGYLTNNTVKVMVVDTFHLFPETMEFLRELEGYYDFEAQVVCAEGVPVGDKAAFDKVYGENLWKEDIEQYDKICKVEPFQRGLEMLNADCMINGRMRWQGFERAGIHQFENDESGLAKCNPIAYWSLEDTFDYIAKYKVPHHPLHAKGYPSIGDAKDTVPVPEDGSTRFVDFKFEGDPTPWLEYASERKGRFVGLVNKDGSTKTECGIHVTGAEKTFERDLWEETTAVKTIASIDQALELKMAGMPAVIAIYAPWCRFCQAMEEEYAKFAEEMEKQALDVYKFRGDEVREFVRDEFDTQTFPTIDVIKPDGTVVKYDSEQRDVASLKAFVESTLEESLG